MKSSLRILSVICLGGTVLLAAGRPGPSQNSQLPQDQDPAQQVELAFQAQGITVDIEAGRCSVPAEICVREDLLEYVLVSAVGATHESLFATGINPSIFNAALVTLGAKKGENVRWVEKDPMPSEEEIQSGAATFDVLPPTGEGFYLYVAWRAGNETYFYRLEDLITNIERGRSMERHAWIYLGSRMVQPDPNKEDLALAAELEGNLINLSYFRAGNTLFTAALADCVYQTIWVPNAPLLPSQGSRVTMIFSRERLASLPAEMTSQLVDLGSQ